MIREFYQVFYLEALFTSKAGDEIKTQGGIRLCRLSNTRRFKRIREKRTYRTKDVEKDMELTSRESSVIVQLESSCDKDKIYNNFTLTS